MPSFFLLVFPTFSSPLSIPVVPFRGHFFVWCCGLFLVGWGGRKRSSWASSSSWSHSTLPGNKGLSKASLPQKPPPPTEREREIVVVKYFSVCVCPTSIFFLTKPLICRHVCPSLPLPPKNPTKKRYCHYFFSSFFSSWKQVSFFKNGPHSPLPGKSKVTSAHWWNGKA